MVEVMITVIIFPEMMVSFCLNISSSYYQVLYYHERDVDDEAVLITFEMNLRDVIDDNHMFYVGLTWLTSPQ